MKIGEKKKKKKRRNARCARFEFLRESKDLVTLYIDARATFCPVSTKFVRKSFENVIQELLKRILEDWKGE